MQSPVQLKDYVMIMPFQSQWLYTFSFTFTVVTGEELNALTEVMDALVSLQAKEQAKGVMQNLHNVYVTTSLPHKWLI